jgi:hypothetical protein
MQLKPSLSKTELTFNPKPEFLLGNSFLGEWLHLFSSYSSPKYEPHSRFSPLLCPVGDSQESEELSPSCSSVSLVKYMPNTKFTFLAIYKHTVQ